MDYRRIKELASVVAKYMEWEVLELGGNIHLGIPLETGGHADFGKATSLDTLLKVWLKLMEKDSDVGIRFQYGHFTIFTEVGEGIGAGAYTSEKELGSKWTKDKEIEREQQAALVATVEAIEHRE